MSKRHAVRIIGGKWRGRKIDVLQVEGLRPTPDRVRETLFNWLSRDIARARCLDLFAGSGVLGFEALSRGAASVTMIDDSKKVTEALQKTKATLAAEHCDIQCASLPEAIYALEAQYDIVFLDPPYRSPLLQQSIDALHQQRLLAPHALLYLEAGHPIAEKTLPKGFELIKAKCAGDVYYHLVHCGHDALLSLETDLK